MKTLVKRFVKDESGATAIEYGLIAALIAIAIIIGATALGVSLNDLFVRLGACMAAPGTPGICAAVLG